MKLADLESRPEKYLIEFGEHFEKIIIEGLKRFKVHESNENILEIAHHLYFCQQLLKKYNERSEYSEKVF